MSTMKRYMDIPRVGHKTTKDYFTQIASQGKKIRITLKLDGANSHFEVDDKKILNSYSRDNLLREEKGFDLRGFYQYVNSKVDPEILPANFKVYGEWLVSHTVVYPKDMYNHFYIFDIYDTKKEEYISSESNDYKNIVAYLVKHCGMKEAPVLYEGPYRGIEHIESILKQVARSDDEYHGKQPEKFEDVFNEGIVVKSYDYRDYGGNQLFVKFVSEKFKEIKKVKINKTPSGPDTSIEKQIAEFSVTPARIEKIINKLIDQGILPEEYDLENMQIIARNVPKMAYDDVMKEELDTIKDEFGEFDEKLIGKKINAVAMNIVKDIIREKVEQRAKSMI